MGTIKTISRRNKKRLDALKEKQSIEEEEAKKKITSAEVEVDEGGEEGNASADEGKVVRSLVERKYIDSVEEEREIASLVQSVEESHEKEDASAEDGKVVRSLVEGKYCI